MNISAETTENEHKDSTRITSSLKAQIPEPTATRVRLEVKSKLNVKKEIKKNYDSSLQHQMRKQNE